MPNLVGQNIYNAINSLEKLGLQYEVQGESGDIVKCQFPSPNSQVSVNSVVMIGIE